jgi:hypothetical protein
LRFLLFFVSEFLSIGSKIRVYFLVLFRKHLRAVFSMLLWPRVQGLWISLAFDSVVSRFRSKNELGMELCQLKYPSTKFRDKIVNFAGLIVDLRASACLAFSLMSSHEVTQTFFSVVGKFWNLGF